LKISQFSPSFILVNLAIDIPWLGQMSGSLPVVVLRLHSGLSISGSEYSLYIHVAINQINYYKIIKPFQEFNLHELLSGPVGQ
jgi:hypothetical protein